MTEKISNIYSGKPVVLVDFDGVIHSYLSGWEGVAAIPDPPTPGAFEWLEKMVVTFDIRIFSARCNDPTGIAAMIEWFRLWMLPERVLSEITFEPGKPSAYMIIDDRAIQFSGDFAALNPGAVQDFRPWYYDDPRWKRRR